MLVSLLSKSLIWNMGGLNYIASVSHSKRVSQVKLELGEVLGCITEVVDEGPITTAYV
jgi:hypothetical protein